MVLAGCNLASLSSVVSNLATSIPQTTPVKNASRTLAGKVSTIKMATPSSKTIATKLAGRTATSAATAKPGTGTGSLNGRIAFVSEREGNYEIYIMNADGSQQQRLTKIGEYIVSPAWSPDGKNSLLSAINSARITAQPNCMSATPMVLT